MNRLRLMTTGLAVLGVTGCGDSGGDEPQIDAGVDPVPILSGPSKSSSVAISSDDTIVAMVNPGDGSVSFFNTADDTRISRVQTGAAPSSVVIHPDNATAFVANRADATIVKISEIGGSTPSVSDPLPVGSEPTGLALSPTGAVLFVAEWAEGSVAVVDSATLTVTTVIDGPVNPRSVAITNDGDQDDADELLVVPEFFGEPQAGGEAADGGRRGRVRMYSVADYSPSEAITFEPIDSGFDPTGGSNPVLTSPNQLYAAAINGAKIYVSSVSASAAPPVRFNGNVHPVVYVGDLESRSEDRGALGSVNLARLAFDALDPSQLRFALADIVDLDFVDDDTGTAYVLSRGSNAIQRVEFGGDQVEIGSTVNTQIEIGAGGCVVPTGIVVAEEGARAYVNCSVTRSLGVIDLAAQELVTAVESSPAPTTPAEIAINDGLKFFFTGRARWSSEAWSTCGSCHPDGLTDNITWSFAAGPRQTISLDGSFSQNQQRIFNWTGVFDEVHDFERNTRGVSGGLGAVTTGECGVLANETRIDLGGNLRQPVKELQDSGCTTDWDEIEAWMRTIRAPRALQRLESDLVTRGRQLFGSSNATENNGDCVKCHAGENWTASRRFYTPSSATNDALADTEPFTPPTAWPATWSFHKSTQIAVQPATADPNGAQGPEQVACVLRNVATFGSDALELRANGARAQGLGGYNVPSLVGLALGAPYLHHGQAASLDDLLSSPAYGDHLQAGNPIFNPSADDTAALVAFLLSIDDEARTFDLAAGFDGCPSSF